MPSDPIAKSVRQWSATPRFSVRLGVGSPYAWLAQLVAMVLINIVFFEGLVVPVELLGKTFEIPTQGFAVFSLVPIWLYGGKKGKSSKIMQYGFYAFYPVHMLILYLIKLFA